MFESKNLCQCISYSLNMLPKSLLIEVRTQTNSKQEALNAIDFLAEILAKVLLSE